MDRWTQSMPTNAPASETPDPFNTGLKHSGLYCSLSICYIFPNSAMEKEMKFVHMTRWPPQLSDPVPVIFMPLIQMGIWIFKSSYNSLLEGLFLVTQSDHILHWHSQLRNTSAYTSRSENVCFRHSQSLFTDVFPADIKVNFSCVHVSAETLGSRAVCVTGSCNRCFNNEPSFKVT